jgi:hypothetical protein
MLTINLFTAKIPDSNEKCKTDNVSGIGRHMRGEPRFYSGSISILFGNI